MTTVDWSAMANKIEQGSSPILFVKEEGTTFRIVAEGMEDVNWYKQFFTEFTQSDGSVKKIENYAVPIIHEGSIKTGVLKKTQLAGIMRTMGNLGIDFLSPQVGYQVVLHVTGSGLQTRYSIGRGKQEDITGYDVEGVWEDVQQAIDNLSAPKDKASPSTPTPYTGDEIPF